MIVFDIMDLGSTENNLVSFKVKHLLLRAGEVSSILTSDRLDRVTSLNNHGLLTTWAKGGNNRKLTSRYSGMDICKGVINWDPLTRGPRL